MSNPVRRAVDDLWSWLLPVPDRAERHRGQQCCPARQSSTPNTVSVDLYRNEPLSCHYNNDI